MQDAPSHHLAFSSTSPRRNRGGFSLIEIMIVVTLIGILASLAVPLHTRLTTRAKHTMFRNDLRAASQALEIYATDKGDWPPDGADGWPAPVMDYLPPPNRWNLPTPVGGHWSWRRDIDGANAAVRVSGQQGGEAEAIALDKLIDDGVLTAGLFRGSSDHLLYILQE